VSPIRYDRGRPDTAVDETPGQAGAEASLKEAIS
jgi:hypothetical protein